MVLNCIKPGLTNHCKQIK
uniref:Uncharacterized protein n=1 Tax=Arundo donax TaxID=35708 RepID=A0A0A9BT99_ARUDO